MVWLPNFLNGLSEAEVLRNSLNKPTFTIILHYKYLAVNKSIEKINEEFLGED
jgi:hypothetical protein